MSSKEVKIQLGFIVDISILNPDIMHHLFDQDEYAVHEVNEIIRIKEEENKNIIDIFEEFYLPFNRIIDLTLISYNELLDKCIIGYEYILIEGEEEITIDGFNPSQLPYFNDFHFKHLRKIQSEIPILKDHKLMKIVVVEN